MPADRAVDRDRQPVHRRSAGDKRAPPRSRLRPRHVVPRRARATTHSSERRRNRAVTEGSDKLQRSSRRPHRPRCCATSVVIICPGHRRQPGRQDEHRPPQGRGICCEDYAWRRQTCRTRFQSSQEIDPVDVGRVMTTRPRAHPGVRPGLPRITQARESPATLRLAVRRTRTNSPARPGWRALEVLVLSSRGHLEEEIPERGRPGSGGQRLAQNLAMFSLGRTPAVGRSNPQRRDQRLVDVPHNQLRHASSPQC